MTPRNAPSRAPCCTLVAFLLALWLPLVAAPALAARDEGATQASEPKVAPTETAKESSPEPERTENLAKPPGGSRPNPEETNPALLNPCHGSPQPKWCGE